MLLLLMGKWLKLYLLTTDLNLNINNIIQNILMSATSKNGGLLGFVSFKMSNPINNFKATFKKHID
jgi:hypothetical protein